jgi:hypothetical protein
MQCLSVEGEIGQFIYLASGLVDPGFSVLSVCTSYVLEPYINCCPPHSALISKYVVSSACSRFWLSLYFIQDTMRPEGSHAAKCRPPSLGGGASHAGKRAKYDEVQRRSNEEPIMILKGMATARC